MNVKKISPLLAWLVIAIVFTAPYFPDNFWKFIPATAAIILWVRYLYPASWRQELGLNPRHWDLISGMVLMGGC